MTIYVTNPLADSRWDDLVARHPQASAFHQRGWLEALSRTYGYQTLVLTTAPADKKLSDGLVVCRVASWITGIRMVSLPFSDHCDPLVNDAGEFGEFVNWLGAECKRQDWKYVELRPLSPVQYAGNGLQPSRSYCFHQIDIRPSLEQVFRGFHKDSIQRRIRRAEREGLTYEVGCSKQLVDEFYCLLLMTKRRHQVLPQPRVWFKNLVECMGSAIQIRMARRSGTPIAALLTLRQRSSVVYKYGCSDERFHQFGGMPFLFWRLIEESKAEGAEAIDLGRSDLENQGLIAFKDKFGASRRLMTYYRYASRESGEGTPGWDSLTLRRFFTLLPDAVFSTAGRVLYRHVG